MTLLHGRSMQTVHSQRTCYFLQWDSFADYLYEIEKSIKIRVIFTMEALYVVLVTWEFI